MPAKTALHVIAKRPGSLGLKDKHREQRKKILKMCVQKLRDIDDPETVLCRAVLINNTFKTLKYSQRFKMPLKKSELKRHSVEDESESSETEARQGHRAEREEDESEAQEPGPEETYVHQTEDSDFKINSNNNSNDINERNCDNNSDSYNAESLVHSLVMPPLLSPQLEDMTNCSFYDNFTPEAENVLVHDPITDSSHPDLSQESEKGLYSEKSDMLSGSLKLTMLKTDLCDVISESNSNNYPQSTFDFSSKVELAACSEGDISNTLIIDNLLTEIVPA